MNLLMLNIYSISFSTHFKINNIQSIKKSEVSKTAVLLLISFWKLCQNTFINGKFKKIALFKNIHFCNIIKVSTVLDE